MSGVRKRLEREFDERITLAWQAAALSGAAQAGKLKPLAHYLSKQTANKQSPAEMVAVLRQFQKRGSDMKIERVRLN